jgi:hypothetical protein
VYAAKSPTDLASPLSRRSQLTFERTIGFQACTHWGHPLTIDTSAWPENVKFPLPFQVGQGEGQRESTTTNTRWDTASRAIMPVLLGSDMSSLGASLLRGPWPSPSTLQASALWSDQTTVIYAIRRMG